MFEVITISTTRAHKQQNKKDAHIGWAGIHCCFSQGVALRDLILVDSVLSDTNFCNPKYVQNIRQAKLTFELGANGGPLVSNQVCDNLDLRKEWFNQN